MSAVAVPFVNDASHGRVAMIFWCPGCDAAHWFGTYGDGRFLWNANPKRPTASPTMFFQTHDGRCEFFLTDGKLTFFGGCHHGKDGQTVKLPVWTAEHERAAHE